MPPETTSFAMRTDIKIVTDDPITYLSIPDGASSLLNPQRTEASVISSSKAANQRLYFRTAQMFAPKLLYEESDVYPGEVALMVSFVPTFEPPQP